MEPSAEDSIENLARIEVETYSCLLSFGVWKHGLVGLCRIFGNGPIVQLLFPAIFINKLQSYSQSG